MSGIFDEGKMMQVLGGCLPEGETLSAAVHGVTLQVNKKKSSIFDVYIGVTERYLLVAECEERRYLNEVYRVPDLRKTVADDISVCFPLAQIQAVSSKTRSWARSTAPLPCRTAAFSSSSCQSAADWGAVCPTTRNTGRSSWHA